MVMHVINARDPNVYRAWQALVSSGEWQIIEKYLRGVTLSSAYEATCSRADQPGRDWLAGRAAMLNELLEDAQQLREESGRSRMPLVNVGAQQV